MALLMLVGGLAEPLLLCLAPSVVGVLWPGDPGSGVIGSALLLLFTPAAFVAYVLERERGREAVR